MPHDNHRGRREKHGRGTQKKRQARSKAMHRVRNNNLNNKGRFLPNRQRRCLKAQSLGTGRPSDPGRTDPIRPAHSFLVIHQAIFFHKKPSV